VRNNARQVRSLDGEVKDMHRVFAALLLCTMTFGNVACSRMEQLRREESLRESLNMLRSQIRQFTLDHGRPPASLSELVSSGYLKRETWRAEKSQAGWYLEVRSGSDATSSNGTK